MGKEIFWFFFSGGHNVSVICIENEEEFRAQIEKQLRKNLKRKLIDESEFNNLMNSFRISSDYSLLDNCDIVVEAVSENESLKSSIFEKVESFVSDKCILATNTSSIPLADIFQRCKNKQRCIGMHFFYPVKLSQFIEINTEKFTSDYSIDIVKQIVAESDKKYIVLSENCNMYLNRAISIVASHAYVWKCENNASYSYINHILDDQMMNYSVFEMIDSIGIGIVSVSSDYFADLRYSFILKKFGDELKRLINDGCSGKPGEFLKYVEPSDNKENKADGAQLTESLFAMLMNDIIYLSGIIQTDVETLKCAVQEVLGLTHTFDSVYTNCGYDKIKVLLDSYYLKTRCDVYRVFEKEKYDKYFLTV